MEEYINPSAIDQSQQNQELMAVNALAEALTLSQGIDSVVDTALQGVINLVEADFGAVYLLEKDSAGLKLKALRGDISPDLMPLIAGTGMNKDLINSLCEIGHVIAVDDIHLGSEISAELASLLSHNGFSSWVCAPLKTEGEVIGVYRLGIRKKRSFSSFDLEVLDIAGNMIGTSLANAQLLRDLRHKEEELRRALHRVVELQEDERKRLARELHDEVGQALTSILILLKTLQEEKDRSLQEERINDLRLLTAQTIEELHRLAMDLRPAALDNLGIVPALRWYAHQCADRTGLDIHYKGPEQYERLSRERELLLYRVAQEGITNAIRHGRAQQITVSLEGDSNRVRMVVKDNGRGFNATVLDQGLGLVGMRERVELLDGSLTIHTAPGAGTEIMVELPLR